MAEAGGQPPQQGAASEYAVAAGADLAVRAEQLGPNLVALQVEGELDMLTSPTLADRVREHFAADGGALVVDMTRVSFLGSAGLAVLAEAAGLAAAHATELRVIATTTAVLRPLEVTGLDERVHTCDSMATAIGQLMR
ncbi:MAG TPA: STAS domain-containing protein [Pseudonocardiaceae bacterium]|nr:STAS domain-containing protein [Pseudonocardiaceae bacterium]